LYGTDFENSCPRLRRDHIDADSHRDFTRQRTTPIRLDTMRMPRCWAPGMPTWTTLTLPWACPQEGSKFTGETHCRSNSDPTRRKAWQACAHHAGQSSGVNLVVITAYDEAEHPIPVMRHRRCNLLWSTIVRDRRIAIPCYCFGGLRHNPCVAFPPQPAAGKR
jgi:hypothetical protein